MFYEELTATMDHLLQEGKGILAADESNNTMAKRFASIGIDNTAQNRCDYRLLLATTKTLDDYISGVILFEETFDNVDEHNKPITTLFTDQNIILGIKVDKGLVELANSEDEKTTAGLDGLTERLLHFKAKGARFAKWRCVYQVSEFTPSLIAMRTNAELLARYAACCQSVGIVPIVEPEILIDGDHSIEQAADVFSMVLHELFHALFIHQVELEYIVLKPSMVTSGQMHKPFSSAEDIADYTINVFRNHVPAAVPTINFLSGGQTPMQAKIHLNAINQLGVHPWILSFSYGRALQEDCLKAWSGDKKNVEKAQKVLLYQAKLTSLACLGDYEPTHES